MKKKKETCKYCGGKMEAKTTRQEFCSNKCRVYFNREIAKQVVAECKPHLAPTSKANMELFEAALKAAVAPVTPNEPSRRVAIQKVKDSCPFDLKGWAKDIWIHNELKKHGLK